MITLTRTRDNCNDDETATKNYIDTEVATIKETSVEIEDAGFRAVVAAYINAITDHVHGNQVPEIVPETPLSPEPPPKKGEFGHFETAGPWYPSRKVPLPFYTESDPPSLDDVNVRQASDQDVRLQLEDVNVGLAGDQVPSDQQESEGANLRPITNEEVQRPSLDQSVKIAPAPSPSPRPTPIHAHTLPMTRPLWEKFRGSPSARSEPFPSKPIESPVLKPERWSETTTATHVDRKPSTSSSTRSRPSFSSVFRQATSLRSANARSNSSSPSQTPNISQLSVARSDNSSSHYLPSALTPYPHCFTPIARPSTVSPMFESLGITTPKALTTTGSLVTNPLKPRLPSHRLEITPAKHLTNKGKNQDITHIDISPTGTLGATRHTSKQLKVWSMTRNVVTSIIKTTSYVPPRTRSREYFVRSHAILSEAAGFIAVSTHFGFTLEIYSIAKPSSPRRVQSLDDAHRWAISRLPDIGIAVYRPKTDRIDHFVLEPSKKPLKADPSREINLAAANLPYVPKFPELTFAIDGPLLVAAAGPRPGDPPRPNPILLAAWLPGSIIPVRVSLPEDEVLKTALPAALGACGSRAVSVWIPAGTEQGKPAAERAVLVWDVSSGKTEVFTIPNVQAAVSPDCKWVAYCDALAGRFVVLDVARGGNEVWRWPDVSKKSGVASFGQFECLASVTVFEFTVDGKGLLVGDASGGVGVYKVKETADAVFELEAQSGPVQAAELE